MAKTGIPIYGLRGVLCPYCGQGELMLFACPQCEQVLACCGEFETMFQLEVDTTAPANVRVGAAVETVKCPRCGTARDYIPARLDQTERLGVRSSELSFVAGWTPR